MSSADNAAPARLGDLGAVFELLHALSASNDAEHSLATLRPSSRTPRAPRLGDMRSVWEQLQISPPPSPPASSTSLSDNEPPSPLSLEDAPASKSTFLPKIVRPGEDEDRSSSDALTRADAFLHTKDKPRTGVQRRKSRESSTTSKGWSNNESRRALKARSKTNDSPKLQDKLCTIDITISEEGKPSLSASRPKSIPANTENGEPIPDSSLSNSATPNELEVFLQAALQAGISTQQRANHLRSQPLYPSSVTPPRVEVREVRRVGVPPSLPFASFQQQGNSTIQPKYSLTALQQKARLVAKLMADHPSDQHYLLRSDPSVTSSPYIQDYSPEAIHIFIDCSNILIGFYESLKKSRGIHPSQMMKQSPLAFHSLALIMERMRPVARRVIVGSSTRDPETGMLKKFDWTEEAEQCGYEMNILDRVQRFDDPIRKTPRKSSRHLALSGNASGSDVPALKRRRMKEQGVDELLHLKMLQSILDTHVPSTMVLATGDAAVAEFSDGFKANVERALEYGWKVELVTWKGNMSNEYRSDEFRNTWGDQFKIIELDQYSEELLAVYSQPSPRIW